MQARGQSLVQNASRVLRVDNRYLNLPVKIGAPKRTVSLWVNGQNQREFRIELADGAPDWWAFTDVSAFAGQSLTVQVDPLPQGSQCLAQLELSGTIKNATNLYHEALRPQLHFSPRRGWNNDPNGLIFVRGVYHLFFQHNPYGWTSDNMQWGHATSTDLVHWTEQPEAIYNDARGAIWSGSAVLDVNNTSGLGETGGAAMALFYTSAGPHFSQCLAYSTDGGATFSKYASNPVLPEITPGDRDPKVIWYEPGKHWVMVLWVERSGRNTIQFLTSPNLKDWKQAGAVDNFFECPDFFELAVDGNPSNKKWVLTAASSEYELGSFDGAAFTPATPKLPGVRSDDFYAAQTFSDIPASDGRRIQIGWLRAASPGMPFNQCQSLPLELTLISTPEGPRLARVPVRELQCLRATTNALGSFVLTTNEPNPLAQVSGELLELRAEFEPGPAAQVDFNLRGLNVSYDAARQELNVNGRRAPAPLRDGRVRLIIYTDRTASEVFASDGLAYVPVAFIPKPEALGASAQVRNGRVRFDFLIVYQLHSIWN